MRTVTISEAALAELERQVPQGVPVTMLNLLRFRDTADYGPNDTLAPCSGRAAYYERYAPAVTPMVMALGGRVVWAGSVLGHPVCPNDERWDDMLVVEYPDIESILGMFRSPDYQAQVMHRTAALADSRLIATREGDKP